MNSRYLNSRSIWLLFASWCFASFAFHAARADEPTQRVPIGPGERVVLVGGGLFERLQTHGYLETLLTTRVAQPDVIVRNLGWSGDDVNGTARAVFGTPEDGFKRLLDDVRAVSPTLIFVGYGNNEAHAGPAGVAPFQRQLARLLDELSQTGARLVLVAPLPYEAKGAPFPDPRAYNRQLQVYIEVMRVTAEQRSIPFVQVAAEPRGWTRDGVQLTELGDWHFSRHLAEQIGYGAPPWRLEIHAANRQYDAVNVAIQSLSVDEGQVSMTLLDRYLPPFPVPASDTGVESGTLRVTGLAAGRYQIFVGDSAVQTATSDQLAQGVSLATRGGDDQFAALRQLIQEKNQLYFHRYRPQNETYLFLFRKHEQGNNAVEIPQFDPLIAEREAQIAELRRPRPYELRLVRIVD